MRFALRFEGNDASVPQIRLIATDLIDQLGHLSEMSSVIRARWFIWWQVYGEAADQNIQTLNPE